MIPHGFPLAKPQWEQTLYRMYQLLLPSMYYALTDVAIARMLSLRALKYLYNFICQTTWYNITEVLPAKIIILKCFCDKNDKYNSEITGVLEKCPSK